jgi:hypothetical protein
MAHRIDGWVLMERIAAQPQRFSSCDTTVALAALLVLRNELVQGVTSEAGLLALADVVGQEPMVEVIENLAGYEAVRILANIEGTDRRAPEAARKRLLEIVQQESAEEEEAPEPAAVGAQGAAAEPVRALRRHRAMGARRIRPSR